MAYSRKHGGEICAIEKSYSPNAVHILADLVSVGPLQFAQLRIPLNLEEHLIAILCRNLVRINAAVSTRILAKNTRKPSMILRGCIRGRWNLADLDVDGRIVLSLELELVLSGGGLCVRHSVSVRDVVVVGCKRAVVSLWHAPRRRPLPSYMCLRNPCRHGGLSQSTCLERDKVGHEPTILKWKMEKQLVRMVRMCICTLRN